MPKLLRSIQAHLILKRKQDKWKSQITLKPAKRFLNLNLSQVNLKRILLSSRSSARTRPISNRTRPQTQRVENRSKASHVFASRGEKMKYIQDKLEHLWEQKQVPRCHRVIFSGELLKLSSPKMVEEIDIEKTALQNNTAAVLTAIKAIQARDRCLKMIRAKIVEIVEMSMLSDLVMLNNITVREIVRWHRRMKALNPRKKFNFVWCYSHSYLRTMIKDQDFICEVAGVEGSNPFLKGIVEQSEWSQASEASLFEMVKE